MTQIFLHRRSPIICLTILFFSITTGCRMAQKIGITQTGAPKYERLDIDYELKNSGGALALEDFSNEPADTSTILQAEATDDDRPQFKQPDWSNAKLKIQYPHPEGKKNLVRATLRLSQGGNSILQSDVSWTDKWSDKLSDGWDSISNTFSNEEKKTIHSKQTTETDDEIWVYDFPKSQLDLMLADLAGSGFFSKQTRQNDSATLSVSIDKGEVSKAWSPEPRLDDIILLVYQEGWLRGFAKNESLLKNKPDTLLPVSFEE